MDDEENPKIKKLEYQMKERINFEGKLVDFLLQKEIEKLKNGRKEGE